MQTKFDETHFEAGFVSPVSARYALTISNSSGAAETTSHSTKRGVRAQVRTWDAKNMTCSVQDGAETIYEGSALGF